MLFIIMMFNNVFFASSYSSKKTSYNYKFLYYIFILQKFDKITTFITTFIPKYNLFIFLKIYRLIV